MGERRSALASGSDSTSAPSEGPPESTGKVRARTGQTGTPDVPVGFEAIRVSFALTGEIPDDRRERLRERTERYCVVLQTLLAPPTIDATWEVAG